MQVLVFQYKNQSLSITYATIKRFGYQQPKFQS